MKLVAGLGNPGRDYERTFHNIGFDVAELLCQRACGEWKDSLSFMARLAKVTVDDTVLLLVKPMTYMNASGESVGPLMRYYKMEPGDVIAVLDDVELPPGRLRIRAGGGTGGHNGLASLTYALGTPEFPRVRIGVGRSAHREQSLAKHVLQAIPAETRAILDKVIPVAADAVCTVARHGVDAAMNMYNGISFEDKPLEDKSC